MSTPDPLPSVRRRVRLAGFADAWRGIRILLSTQPNARLHLFATVLVIGMGGWFRLSLTEWSLLVIAIALVWVTEAVNTAIEFTVDLISPEWHRLAGLAKDVAAGAVLLAALFATILGGLIFGPRILVWWHG